MQKVGKRGNGLRRIPSLTLRVSFPGVPPEVALSNQSPHSALLSVVEIRTQIDVGGNRLSDFGNLLEPGVGITFAVQTFKHGAR